MSTTIQHCLDVYLPFWASLIFPNHSPITALILTYAMIPLGMLARPIGAIVFGIIGDLYGRGHALFLTMVGMAIFSACMALCPTYAAVGVLAPLLFCFGRIVQNFLAAGETMGGAIILLEDAKPKQYDVLSSFYGASTMVGHFLASFGVFLIGHFNFLQPGWRILYLFGCITAVFGCFFRKCPVLSTTKTDFRKKLLQMKAKLLNNLGAFVCIVIASGFASACYSMALVFINGFVPLISEISTTQIMKINSYLLILDFLTLPLFGFLASKVQREKVMLAAASGVICFALPLFNFLHGASIAYVIALRVILIIFGVAFFAPFYAWVQELVPKECRCLFISLGYALGSQLLGSPTAAIALWSYKATQMISSVVWYWMVLAFGSVLAVALSSRLKNRAHQKAAG